MDYINIQRVMFNPYWRNWNIFLYHKYYSLGAYFFVGTSVLFFANWIFTWSAFVLNDFHCNYNITTKLYLLEWKIISTYHENFSFSPKWSSFFSFTRIYSYCKKTLIKLYLALLSSRTNQYLLFYENYLFGIFNIYFCKSLKISWSYCIISPSTSMF